MTLLPPFSDVSVLGDRDCAGDTAGSTSSEWMTCLTLREIFCWRKSARCPGSNADQGCSPGRRNGLKTEVPSGHFAARLHISYSLIVIGRQRAIADQGVIPSERRSGLALAATVPSHR
jgi:hypothetical protein